MICNTLVLQRADSIGGVWRGGQAVENEGTFQICVIPDFAPAAYRYCVRLAQNPV